MSSEGTSTSGGHRHTVSGYPTSAASGEVSHTHRIEMHGLTLESGPAVQPMEAGFVNEKVVKGFLPDLVDPDHKYVFKTGEFGLHDYWYKDRKGNYWKYSNAPEDHTEFDKRAGVPLLDKEQPMPHTAPQFFAENGRKRHIGVPAEVTTEINPNYNPLDAKNLWYEVYKGQDGSTRYVYLDSDLRENLDLWVQYQLRVTDSGISKYRQFAVNMFNNQHPKNRIVGAILMLVEQGLFEVEELADATIDDLEFIDETVKLLGRKVVCDLQFYDFLTSLVANREGSDPLFAVDTIHGRNSFGYNYLYSVFKFLHLSPYFILYWRASQMFSRIMTRLALTKEIEPEEIEGHAFSELQRMFSTQQNIKHLVDYRVRKTLLENYGVKLTKAMERQVSDDYGVVTIWSDLIKRRGDEQIFSQWLHAEPMHDTSPEEEANVENMLAEPAMDETSGENTKLPGPETKRGVSTLE